MTPRNPSPTGPAVVIPPGHAGSAMFGGPQAVTGTPPAPPADPLRYVDPKTITPSWAAERLGLDLKELRASFPDDLVEHIDTALCDRTWLASRLTPDYASGAPRTPADQRQALLAECQRRSGLARSRDEAAKRRRRESVCAVTGIEDPSTRWRDLSVLTKQHQGRVRLSDRGLAAVIAAIVRTADPDDVDAATRWITEQGIVVAPVEAPTSTKSRRSPLRRTG